MRRKSTISLTSAASLAAVEEAPLGEAPDHRKRQVLAHALASAAGPGRAGPPAPARCRRGRSAPRAGCRSTPACPRARCVPVASAAPNSAWKSSRWPWPCRPPTPSTSPSRRSKLTPWSRRPLAKSSTLSAMRSVAVGTPLGIEPVEIAADHLGDDLVVADRARLVRRDGACRCGRWSAGRRWRAPRPCGAR